MNKLTIYFIGFFIYFAVLPAALNEEKYFISFLLVSPVIFLFLRNLRRKHKKQELIDEQARLEKEALLVFQQAFDQHGGTLRRKYAQACWFDDYGVQHTEKAEEEIKYFIKKVLDINLNDHLYPLAFDFIQGKINTAESKEDQGIEEHDVEAMGPIEFEHYCANILRHHGWNAYATKGSGDQGTDVIAEKDSIRVVLQCKLYSNPVGNKAVQEVNAGKTFEQAKIACVVTNSTYTKSARQLAQATGVLLLHPDDLPQLSTRIQAFTTV